MKAPKLHKTIPARMPCVTDVLCNWEITSQIVNTREVILGPIIEAVERGGSHLYPQEKFQPKGLVKDPCRMKHYKLQDISLCIYHTSVLRKASSSMVRPKIGS